MKACGCKGILLSVFVFFSDRRERVVKKEINFTMKLLKYHRSNFIIRSLKCFHPNYDLTMGMIRVCYLSGLILHTTLWYMPGVFLNGYSRVFNFKG